MNATYPRLASLIAANFGVPEQQMTPDTTFDDLEFDSLALVELALTVEQEFQVKIADDALSSNDTLAHAADLIDIMGVRA